MSWLLKFVTRSSLTSGGILDCILNMDPSHDEVAASPRSHLEERCAELERLLHGLLDSKGRVGEEIHAIRKLGKSLRAGFALLGLEKSAAKEIRVIGRLLSGPRDAASRLSTWQKLGWEENTVAGSAIAGLLYQQVHSAARRPPPAAIEWCVERVEIALAALREPVDDAKPLAKRLCKLERKLVRRCRKLDHRGADDFHAARKALKAYCGAAGFLPDGAVQIDPTFVELAGLLGDENDMATLAFWLSEHGFTPEFVPALWEKLEDRWYDLRQRAIGDATAVVAQLSKSRGKS